MPGLLRKTAGLAASYEVVLTPLYATAAILVGFVSVVWGADRFVHGAAALATNAGISRLVIGLTIVAFGTSAPEMLVSAMAAWAGSPQMGIGNAIGSNVTNTTLVLGAAAIVRPLQIHSRILLRELPVLLGITIVAWAFLWDGNLSRAEGLVLLGGMFLLVFWIGLQARKEASEGADPMAVALDSEIPAPEPTWRALLAFLGGLVFLLLGSRILVWGAVGIARGLGVSEFVIGLTLVALGTSLPELAASITAARRNEQDIAVGNVVGSNMFNLLGVLSLPGIIRPDAVVSRVVVTRDFPIMFAVTVLLLLLALAGTPHSLGRRRGSLLVCVFVVYFVMLFARPS